MDKYEDFVISKTSQDSLSVKKLIERLQNLPDNYARLLTGAIGACSESGELLDEVKKLTFHGKAITKESLEAIEKELGDIEFYLVLIRDFLSISRDRVINKNMDKLNKRYKEGFTQEESENRKD